MLSKHQDKINAISLKTVLVACKFISMTRKYKEEKEEEEGEEEEEEEEEKE